MSVSSPTSPSHRQIQPDALGKFLSTVSLPWVITIGYMVVMLILPASALITKSLATTPGEFWQIATSPIALSAYNVTFVTSFLAASVNGLMGTLCAWVLVRYEFPGKKILDAGIDLPFALPTSVAGLVLATLYSDNGWIGKLFAPLGIRIAFTRLGVFVAMIFITLPFVVRTIQPVIQEMEKDTQEASSSLGASKMQTFWLVTLPPLLPHILTGVAMGFSRAIGEYGSVVIIASSIPFKDLVAPVLIFQKLEQYDYTGATIIGTVLLLGALFLSLLINLLQQWGRRYAV